jgi:phospholipase/lecithinase/hemolysin
VELNMDCVQVKLIGALLLCLSSFVRGQNPPPNKPAYFIFGDSLVDPGNNNYLPAALAKANFPRNGIDFPAGPTGRFCNGRTVTDVVADLIGVPYPPPYLQPSVKNGQGIVTGVSYASAAGGILDATGGNYVERIGLNLQIEFFKNTLAQLQSQLGITEANTLLATGVCTIVIGSNDFINNYLLADTVTKYQYTPHNYNILLLTSLSGQLTTLYNLGFRRFTVSNVGPLGCIPEQLAIAKTQVCVQSTNDQVMDYNAGLKTLLTQLASSLPGSTFLYANVYDAVFGLIQNPLPSGFTTVNEGCCGAGLYNAQIPCLPIATPCADRSKYIFWDGYHPTEAANVILANGLWSGGLNSISPMNVQQLLNI